MITLDCAYVVSVGFWLVCSIVGFVNPNVLSLLLDVSVNPDPFVHLIWYIYSVSLVNPVNVWLLVVPLSTHVEPLSLLYSYFVIPDSISEHVAVIVTLSVLILPTLILALGLLVSILLTV